MGSSARDAKLLLLVPQKPGPDRGERVATSAILHDAEEAPSSANNEMLRLRDGRTSCGKDDTDRCALVNNAFRLYSAAVELGDVFDDG